MDPRELLRPLPLAAIAIFAAVAAIDVTLDRFEPALPVPVLLDSDQMTFAAAEPVLDFRRGSSSPVPFSRPLPVGDGWFEPDPQGRWIATGGAVFETELADTAFRWIVVECRLRRGGASEQSLRIVANGVDCGSREIGADWSTAAFALGAGAVRSGRNRIELRLADRMRQGRALLVRRVAFSRRADRPSDLGSRRPPVEIDAARETVTLRASGTLEIGFTMHEEVDALIVGYRFRAAGGSADLVVERVATEDLGERVGVRRRWAGSRRQSGWERVLLHGHRGNFVVRVEAELGSPPGALVLSPMRLVDEG